MKRLITFISTLFLLSSIASAGNLFDHRLFEVEANLPVNLSNNYFSIKDIFFTGDGIIKIDLKDMANSLPKSGFGLIAEVSPDVGINLNFNKFKVGAIVGVDLYGNIGLGKGIIDFLGNGNELNKDIEAEANFNLDLFAYAKVPVDLKIRRLSLNFSPSLFFPVVHGSLESAKATVTNDESGKFSVNVNGVAALYGICDISKFFSDSGFAFNPQDLLTILTDAFSNKNFGFDMEGGIGWDYTKAFNVSVNYRFPIFPGRLNYKTSVGYEFNYEATAATISSAQPETSSTPMSTSVCEYVINRPLKLNITAVFDPFHSRNFTLTGMAGFAVRHPFSSNIEEVDFYPEYNFGVRLSLANIITVNVNTSYIDQIYEHKAGLAFNIRLAEVRAGISVQSSNFITSFQATGIGAYLTVFAGL